MKINRAFPIEQLMDAVDYYLATTNKRIMFEYILLRDVNDQREHAAELAELLSSRRSMVSVNLIPYNPVDEHSQYQRSTEESILGFYDTLKRTTSTLLYVWSMVPISTLPADSCVVNK